MPNTGQMETLGLSLVRRSGLTGCVLAGLAVACSAAPGPPPVERTPPPDARSVIVIVVDTLRADHLGLYGYGRPTSPNLDAWAETGRVYERAFATAPWTLPSFGSLYTGRWPLVHRAGAAKGLNRDGRTVPEPLSPSVSTLAERLREHGHVTGAVVNNPFLDPTFGVARGFDVYDYEPGDNRSIRRADSVVDGTLSLLDTWGARPFLLVVHFFDPHMDYDPPLPTRGRFSATLASRLSLPITDVRRLREGGELGKAEIGFIEAAYDEEIAFVDQEIGRLRRELAGRALLEDALVVLTSDHGEELFEHGGFEHGHAMWQEVLHVPLIVWGRGVEPGRESAPVSLVDVMPTILDWIGLQAPAGVDGVSLLPNLTRRRSVPTRPVLAEGRLYGREQTAVIEWPLKAVMDASLEPVDVFDLEGDPWERRGRLETHLAYAQRVGRVLDARRRRRSTTHEPVLSEPPAPDVLERLRSLGYIR